MASSTPQTHQVDKGSVINEQAQDPEIIKFRDHQRNVVRLSPAEESKTLVSNNTYGVISTILAEEEAPGFPGGSIIEYALDSKGQPIFCISTMSYHTKDLKQDNRCTLTVQSKGFSGLADARFSLTGKARQLEGEEAKEAKETYTKQLPDSYWIHFGDFLPFKMDQLITGRYIGGFGIARQVSGDDYVNAEPDQIFPISARVAGHMNEDHMDANIAIVKHYVGLTVDKAYMSTIDKLGINFKCNRKEQSFKCRVNYTRIPESGKDIKDIVVEMTKASKAAA